MWQLRKLSTNEPLNEAGPLPNNWGPIFGLHGFLEKIGDLSWIAPAYQDTGWVKLTEGEVSALKAKDALARIKREEAIARERLQNSELTVGQKYMWDEYLFAIEALKLVPDLSHRTPFPARPNE